MYKLVINVQYDILDRWPLLTGHDRESSKLLYWCPLMFYRRYTFSEELLMQSVPITTDVVSSNLDQGVVYNIMW